MMHQEKFDIAFIYTKNAGEMTLARPIRSNKDTTEIWFPTKKTRNAIKKVMKSQQNIKNAKDVVFSNIPAEALFEIIRLLGGLDDQKHAEGQLPPGCIRTSLTEIELIAKDYSFALSVV